MDKSYLIVREGTNPTEYQAGQKVKMEKISVSEDDGLVSGAPAKGSGQAYKPWFSYETGFAGCTCDTFEKGEITYCRHIIGLFEGLSKKQEKYGTLFLEARDKNEMFASFKTDSGYISTGCDAVDDMLGGGIPRGVVTLLGGPTKVGKTFFCGQMSFKTCMDKGRVLYIDSVLGDTPILVKKNNHIHIIPIEDFSWAEDSHYREVKDVDVWTDGGWQPIKYIYKHKVKKTMYRILTTKGFVETTEDHSFVVDGKEVSPKDFKVGDNVEMVNYQLDGKNKVPEDLAWVFGLFAADGSANFRDIVLDTGNLSLRHTWSICNTDIVLLERAQEILYKYGLVTEIHKYPHPGVNKLASKYELKKFGNLRMLAYWFNKAQSHKYKRKIVPSFILNGDIDSQKAFLDGYMAGDGHYYENRLSFCSKDKSLMDGLCKILSRLGYDYILYTRDDKPNIVQLSTRGKSRKNLLPEEIRKIETYEIDDYVYDIETANHHFCGGIGSILLHNTEHMLRRKENFEQLEKLMTNRWKYKGKIKGFYPMQQHNLYEVGKLFGIYIYVPKGSERKLIPIIKKEYNKYSEIPIFKIAKSKDVDLIIFDGLTQLFKSAGVTTSSSQNLIGRGEIINLIFESFEGIAGELDVGFVLTSHSSRDNRYFNLYEDIMDKQVTEKNIGVWGGSSLFFNVKHFIQIEDCTADYCKGRNIKHVMRRLYPFRRSTHVDVAFLDDFGFASL